MSKRTFNAVIKKAAKMAVKSFLRYLVAIYGVARSIPSVGVAGATTAIILGQVFTAAVLDCFGLFGLEKIPFNWYRILGALAMAGGAWLLLRRSERDSLGGLFWLTGSSAEPLAVVSS